jgi:hypothetical protein
MKFNKTDMKGVKEARFFREGFNGLAQLREPYDVNISCYGMPRIFPGQMIYVDPIGMGSALGSPSTENSIAYLLGFGGYHQVIKIKNSIKAGEYTTDIESKWISSGNSTDPRRGALIGEGSGGGTCSVLDDANLGVSPGSGGDDPTFDGGPWPTEEEAAAERDAANTDAAQEMADDYGMQCFVAGTTVSVPGINNSIAYINIENIKTGDMVLSYDLTNAQIQPARVIGTIAPLHCDIVEFIFANGTHTRHTFDHPYYVVDKGWSSYAPDLTISRYSDKSLDLSQCAYIDVGDLVISDSGDNVELIAINVIESNPVPTYNIFVDTNSNYFADGILVHNEAI